jgi:DNA-binding PadR family transcriptional regulator
MSLRNVILAILSEEPATGYDIAKKFEGSVRYFWNATHQQIYRDLKVLAREGLVEGDKIEQHHRPNKIVYQLSEAGNAELTRWIAMPSEPRVNSDILVKLMAAATVSPDFSPPLMSAQREIHVQRLEEYRRIEREVLIEGAVPTNTSLAELMRLMALRRGIRGEEDWIGWIDEVLAALQQHQAHNSIVDREPR